MFKALKTFFETQAQLQSFQKSDDSFRELVVYSEGPQDWPHIGPILEKYLELSSGKISYLSSEKNDPGLSYSHPHFKSYFIGSGTSRTILFKTLNAKVCLMTLPDLEVYELKKSAYPVHYVYAYHSINSTHTVYRERAFEHYDTILCVGPHHINELRKEESIKKLPRARRLLEHGSVKLDALVEQYKTASKPSANDTPFILLAPSWGECSFAEDPQLVEKMIHDICSRGWICSLRLHPMTTRLRPSLSEGLKKKFSQHEQSGLFRVETNMNDNSSLKAAHVMVSDWSGAATEFAFALGKPVLFLNTPQKINNPRWESFEMPGLEDSIRHEIGKVLEPSQISLFAASLQELMQNSKSYEAAIAKASSRWIFNPGKAAEAGAKHLIQIIQETSK